jgi:hypothetical protein
MSMRPTAETPSPEPPILRARVEGSLSADAKFDQHHLGRIAAWRASLR